MSKLQKKLTAHKRGHPKLQNMNFKHFFSTFVGNFCPPGSGSGFRIRIQIHWPHWIRIQSGSGSETLPTSAGCSLLIFWRLKPSRSLDVLYGGLGISKFNFFIIKMISCQSYVFQLFIIWTLDPDPEPDPGFTRNDGSGFSESGSSTLISGWLIYVNSLPDCSTLYPHQLPVWSSFYDD